MVTDIPCEQIATGFVKNGVKVYISSRSVKDCNGTADELNALGPGQCIPIPADMQKLSEVERLVSEISKREKALHILVNNAGAVWGAGIDEYPVRASLLEMQSRSSASLMLTITSG